MITVKTLYQYKMRLFLLRMYILVHYLKFFSLAELLILIIYSNNKNIDSYWKL